MQVKMEDWMGVYKFYDEVYETLKERIPEFCISKGWLECALDVRFRSETSGSIIRVFDDIIQEPIDKVIDQVYRDSYCHVGPTLDKWLANDHIGV